MAQLVEQRVRPVEGEPGPWGGGADAADAREAVKVDKAAEDDEALLV